MAGPWEQYQQQPAAAPAEGPWSKYSTGTATPEFVPEKPNAMARVGRGMMDVGQGMKQLWLMATDPEAAKQYTKSVNDEIAMYEKGRGKDAGIDWMRIGGNIAATAPAILIPGANAATLGGRMAAGAGSGAVANSTMFSDEATAGAKLGQAALGGVAGGVMPAAITGAVKAGAGTVNAGMDALGRTIRAATGQTGNTQVNITLQQTLASRGIDFNKLSGEAKAALAADVRETLKAGATLNADELERKAAMLAVGAKPTQAMVTRDPNRWAFERNTADIQGAGERLKARFMGNNQAFNEFAGDLQRGTGGTAADQWSASKVALDAMRTADATKKAGVDAAYDAARDNLGRASPMDSYAFHQAANAALDEGMLGHYLPAQVRGILNDVATGKIPFNVNTAVQIDSVLSAAQRSGNAAEAKAIGVVRSALNDAPIESSVGEHAKSAFDAARGLAKNRFAEIEKIPGLKAAIDGVEPDQFFGKFVLRGNAQDIHEMGKYLSQSDPAAWNDIRGQTVQWLIDKATNGKGAEGTFSGSGLRRALDSLGTQRMQALFSQSEIAQIQTLAKAASAGTETPAFAKASVGSNTAEKVTNLLSKAGNLPYLRNVVVQPLKDFSQNNQVSQALTGAQSTPVSALPKAVSQQAQEAAAKRAGVGVVPLSVLVNGLANQ